MAEEKKELWEIAVEQMRETVRNKGGRPRKFKSPTELIDAFARYCQWAKDNPVTTSERTNKKSRAAMKDGKVMITPDSANSTTATIARPLSIDGFCAFAGIANWTQLKENYAGTKGFMSIFTGIERAIREQQTAGGLVGIYDASLTARLTGLAEKKEVTMTADVTTKVTYKSFMPHTDE